MIVFHIVLVCSLGFTFNIRSFCLYNKQTKLKQKLYSFFFLIEVQLIHNVTLVSGSQHRDLTTLYVMLCSPNCGSHLSSYNVVTVMIPLVIFSMLYLVSL